MRKSAISLIFLAGGMLAAGQAAAANVSFNGLILDSCAVTLGVPGALGVDSTGRTLGSAESGGVSGAAVVLTTSGAYKLEVDPPSSFAVAPANSTPDNIAATFNATGVTSIVAQAAGTPLNLNLGLTNVAVNTTATRSASIFPSGIYRVDVALRCVPR